MTDITNKDLTLRGHTDYASARAAAEESIGDKGEPFMVAWYDDRRGEGGPAEACGGEPPKCVEDYARAHGADMKITINKGEFQFYFKQTPEDTATLDRDQALDIHEDLPGGYDNIQGG